jgi:hypothetical protein
LGGWVIWATGVGIIVRVCVVGNDFSSTVDVVKEVREIIAGAGERVG